MELERLKLNVDVLLAHGVVALQEKGAVDPMLELVKADGTAELMPIEGRLLNDGFAKSAIATLVRARVAAGGIEAVLLLSDIYYAVLSPESHRIMQERRLTVKQAADAGLCEKAEAVMVILDAPDYHQIARQPYKRVDGRIDLGERFDADSTMAGFGGAVGRFVNFFPQAQKAGQ